MVSTRHLLELDNVLSNEQLTSIKLVSTYGLQLNEKSVLKTRSFSHLYRLIEKTYSKDSPSLLVTILSRLNVLERHLFHLKEATHGIYTDFSRFPLLDLILTLIYILNDLSEVKFHFVKEHLLAIFVPEVHSSHVETQNSLVKLLLDKNILHMTRSLDMMFAALESSGCPLYRQYLHRHFTDCQKLPEPNWRPLVPIVRKCFENFGGSLYTQDQLFRYMLPLEASYQSIVIQPDDAYTCYQWKVTNDDSQWKVTMRGKGKGDIIEWKDINKRTRHSTNCYCLGCLLLAVIVFIILGGAVFFFYMFVIAKHQKLHF